MVEKKLVTAHELAEILDLSVDTVWRYTRENRIPHIEVGPRQYRYVKADVLQALQKKEPVGLVQEQQAEYVAKPKLTYGDYAKIPNEPGYTLQLIDGLLIREPGPSLLHQRVSARLQLILALYYQEIDQKGEVLYAPLDVLLDKHTVVQPDLLYLPSTRPAKRAPIEVLPELVVEITSPSSARTDAVRKMHSYQKAGVPHYWIVDPSDHSIKCYQFQDGCCYALVVDCNEGVFNHPAFPGLTFELRELFAEVSFKN